MAQLTNLIPATTGACRKLLGDLRGRTSATVHDRYGTAHDLGKEDVAQLTRLVEAQIGEKAPSKTTKQPAKKAKR